jgi:hypothetical protein
MEYWEVATYWTIRLRKRSIKNFFGRRGRRKPAWPERGAQGKKLGQRESPLQTLGAPNLENAEIDRSLGIWGSWGKKRAFL